MAEEVTNIKSATLRGGVWVFAAQPIKLICQIGSIAVLGRFVIPEDFGMIGMLASVLAILELFRDMGLSAAIVQREKIDQPQLKALFFLSIGLGVVMFGLVSLVGFLLSGFIDEPRLVNVSFIYGILFFFNSLGCVPLGLLRRKMMFKAIAIRDSAAVLLGAIVGISVAISGGGYWALVAMVSVSCLTNLVSVWAASGWLPVGKAASVREIASLLKFGGAFTLGETANYLCQHLDNILIGRFCGTRELGFYTRGYALMLAPVAQVMGPIGTLLVPALSRLNGHREQYRNWVQSLFFIFMFGSAPVAAWLIAGSDEVIAVLLGSGWEPTAVIASWLAISIFGKPIASLVYMVFMTTGDMRGMLRWTLVNAVLTVLAIVIGVNWGAAGVAAAYSVTGLAIRTPVAIWFVGKTGRISCRLWMVTYAGGVVWFGAWLGLLTFVDSLLTEQGVGNVLHLMALGAASLATGAVLLGGTRFGRNFARRSIAMFREALAKKKPSDL